MKIYRVKVLALTLAFALMLCGCAGSGQSSESPSSSSSDTAPSPTEGLTAPSSPAPSYNSESYLDILENREIPAGQESMLTFSLKVDTASYTNIERYLQNGQFPPANAVRTEELINYFSYDAPIEFAGEPFALYTEVAPSPFDPEKHIAFVRVKTSDVDKKNLPASNLTFLIDTSGSMDSYDKLPLLKSAFSLLVENLGENDRISIVTYAGSAGVVLDSASGSEKARILKAINNLEAGGSTAGAKGIITAYALAQENFLEGGNNRVILATDGDFNVGPSSNDDLSRLIQQKRSEGVYLSILGFGTGNIRDDLMETLSKYGNGNYAYINSIKTAQKVLVEELGASLFVVADDVKAQVEFNPANVTSYRLIGYENRRLRNEDFADDTKDAGEIGVGTDVVILFELVLAGETTATYKYTQSNSAPAVSDSSPFVDELFEVRIRYKDPGGNTSKLVTKAVAHKDIRRTASTDLDFACAVMGLGELLRESDYLHSISPQQIKTLAQDNLGQDPNGYRKDFLNLLDFFG